MIPSEDMALTKQVTLYLSREDYRVLKVLSETIGKTMGDLIRYAIRKVYGPVWRKKLALNFG